MFKLTFVPAPEILNTCYYIYASIDANAHIYILGLSLKSSVEFTVFE